MMMRPATWFGVGLAAVFLGPAAEAQLRNAGVSRPAEGPSTRVGRVGGLFPELTPLSLNQGRQSPADFRRPLPSFAPGAGRPSSASQMLSLNRPPPPQNTARGGGANLLAFGRASGSQLAAISELSAVLSLESPLGGYQSFALPESNGGFVPPPDDDPFNAFFNLRPAGRFAPGAGPTLSLDGAPEGASQESIGAAGPTTLVDQLELDRERYLDGLSERAAAAFKLGTTPTADDQTIQLSRARALLTSLRDLDRQSYLPCLLLAYIGMSQGDYDSASHNILTAIERYPGLMMEKPSLASYFGDATLIEDRARAHVRFGDTSASLRNYIIQSFAAWLVDDRARFTNAAMRFEELRRTIDSKDARLTKFRYALGARLSTINP